MSKKKPYVAPAILCWDFANDQIVGNDTDKFNEIEKIVCSEQIATVDEYLFQLQCPFDREI